MEADITDFIKACQTFQRLKRNEKKCGKLLPKEVTTMTRWESICIGLIAPYIVTDNLSNEKILNIMTFVDPAIVWYEILELLDKTSNRIS